MAIRERIREYRTSTVFEIGVTKYVSIPKGVSDSDFPCDCEAELVPELREKENGEAELVYRPKRGGD